MKKKKVFFIFLVFLLLISLHTSSAFSGTTTLSWEPPSINADGTPLTDLAGYMIYYGTNPGNYSQGINVGDVTTYTVNNLTEGLTYYFATTAYDTVGNESEYSNETYKPVALRFYFDLVWQAPLIALLLAFFAAGALFGLAAALAALLRQRRELQRLKREAGRSAGESAEAAPVPPAPAEG